MGYGCGVVGHCVMCPGAGVQGVWLCCGTLCDVSWCRCPGDMAVLWDTV